MAIHRSVIAAASLVVTLCVTAVGGAKASVGGSACLGDDLQVPDGGWRRVRLVATATRRIWTSCALTNRADERWFLGSPPTRSRCFSVLVMVGPSYMSTTVSGAE